MLFEYSLEDGAISFGISTISYYDPKVGAKTYQALIHQMFIDIDLNEKVLTEVMELYRPKGLDMDAVFIQ